MNGLFSLGFPSPVEDSHVSLRIPSHVVAKSVGTGPCILIPSLSGSWQRCASEGLFSPWYTQDKPHAARFPDQSSLPQFPHMKWCCPMSTSPLGMDRPTAHWTGEYSSKEHTHPRTASENCFSLWGAGERQKLFKPLGGEYRQLRVNAHHWLEPGCWECLT